MHLPSPPDDSCRLRSSPQMQTLAGIMSGVQRLTQHPILEPFYRLLADLKAKVITLGRPRLPAAHTPGSAAGL